MSHLTSKLLVPGARQLHASKTALLGEVADRLTTAYGRPTLGNFRDPIKEIFYILLSARTSEVLYQRAHRALFARHRTVSDLAQARIGDVRQCVAGAGLGGKRARQVVATAKALLRTLGANPAKALRRMSPTDAYECLVALPGLGPKSALCVMMCSLDMDVFPVDANVQRILARIGILRAGLKHYRAQQLAPKFVPLGRSKDLHVGLVVHGRRVCMPARPRCIECILLDLCRHGRRRVKHASDDSAV